MPTITLERAEQIVADWRSDTGAIDGWDNPAGALYTGRYAQADITMANQKPTLCPTPCTASRTTTCC